MIYLAAAFLVLWLLTFLVVASIYRRQSRLKDQISTLERAIRGTPQED
jgi:CcmD family protein